MENGIYKTKRGNNIFYIEKCKSGEYIAYRVTDDEWDYFTILLEIIIDQHFTFILPFSSMPSIDLLKTNYPELFI